MANKTYPSKVPANDSSNTFFRPTLSAQAPNNGAPKNWANGKEAISKPNKKVRCFSITGIWVCISVICVKSMGLMPYFKSRNNGARIGNTNVAPKRSINTVRKTGISNRLADVSIIGGKGRNSKPGFSLQNKKRPTDIGWS